MSSQLPGCYNGVAISSKKKKRKKEEKKKKGGVINEGDKQTMGKGVERVREEGAESARNSQSKEKGQSEKHRGQVMCPCNYSH